MKNNIERIVHSSFHKKGKGRKALPSLALLPLLGCGAEEIPVETVEEIQEQSPTISDGKNYFDLVVSIANTGSIDETDIITATNETFISATSLIDENPYDNDELTVTATDDITDVPTISGIETINFTTAATSLGGDLEFDVNLLNISGSDLINFENTNTSSAVVTLDITNVASALSLGSHFTTAKLAAQDNSDLVVELSSDMTLSTTGNSQNLTVNASGKNVTLASSTTAGTISISNADVVDINTISTGNNLTIVANGNVSLNDTSQLQGNINIRSGGTIDITNATAATGTLTLSNERAPDGSDITLTNTNSFGNVSISSVGSITATANNGLSNASRILATAAEDSSISADGVANQTISLNAVNIDSNTTQFTLNASTLEQLNLGGSSPIVVVLDGGDISTETISNTNSDATLWLSGADIDLIQVDTTVKLRLKNFDGHTLTIKDNQDFYLDAEFDQTAATAIPVFDHVTDATALTTNAISLKSFDSETSNGDTTLAIAGLTFTDIQTVNLQLLSTIGLDSSADITGADLTSVVVTGSGFFDLNSNTIAGSSTSRVTLDASALTGVATLYLDATNNGVANIQTGSASDNITIDGVTADASGYVIATNESADTINITTNGDGTTAVISINGGAGTDILSLAAGVDLSSSTLGLTSVETIQLTGGGTSQKIAASDISGVSFTVSESGAGTAILTVVADQTTIDLSNLSFDNSFAVGTDSILIDASGAASGVTITGTSGTDTITGSNANDIITGGDAADTISGGTGDDTISGGNGADTLTGGAGDDEFDFTSGSSTEAEMDGITDFQADADDQHNDTIDNITGTVGADTTNTDVKSAISGGSGSETVTASVSTGIVTLSGADAGSIDSLAEWIDAVSVDGVIALAADDADSTGTVAFQFNGNTYLVESNDTFDNNTPNVSIVSVIELTGLTGVTAVADAAAATTILIA